MKLHEDPKLFRQSILATAEMMEIQEIYIEKDYWVTLALKNIFASKAKEYAVFKGGTALSKCHSLIDRFSEDIDLVVIHTEEEAHNQRRNKIKAISKEIETVLPEIQKNDITSKGSMIRKTCHSYPKTFDGIYGQVRDFIVLEASWLGYFEPHTNKLISSYIYDMMVSKDQSKLAKEYDMLPFEVRVLSLERTLCEKIMSLVRFSYGENPIEDLRNKVRHTYDLKKLLDDPSIKDFLESDQFEVMLNKVGNDDLASYKSDNEWLPNHPAKALIFVELDSTWDKLKISYSGEFKDLVYGELPTEEKIHDALKTIGDRLKSITWNLEETE
jgi:predicted nucleotidyltransferase component of viral defense system